jgi:hypothetical protein
VSSGEESSNEVEVPDRGASDAEELGGVEATSGREEVVLLPRANWWLGVRRDKKETDRTKM